MNASVERTRSLWMSAGESASAPKLAETICAAT